MLLTKKQLFITLFKGFIMWQTKTFTTQDELKRFLKRNYGKYQFIQIFVNNAYGVEYRPLRRVY